MVPDHHRRGHRAPPRDEARRGRRGEWGEGGGGVNIHLRGDAMRPGTILPSKSTPRPPKVACKRTREEASRKYSGPGVGAAGGGPLGMVEGVGEAEARVQRVPQRLRHTHEQQPRAAGDRRGGEFKPGSPPDRVIGDTIIQVLSDLV